MTNLENKIKEYREFKRMAECVCQDKNTALVNEKLQHPIDTEKDGLV